MDTPDAKDLELFVSIPVRDQHSEQEEAEAIHHAIQTVANELAMQRQTFVAAERIVIRLVQGEVKRLLN